MLAFDNQLNKQVDHNHSEYINRMEMRSIVNELDGRLVDLERKVNQLLAHISQMVDISPKTTGEPKIETNKSENIKDLGKFEDIKTEEFNNHNAITDGGTF